MQPRVLIIGTVPYKNGGTSRALDAFFHNWKKENLVQIFSDRAVPVKGHCISLYQITDIDLIKSIFMKNSVGTIYHYSNLNEESICNTYFTKTESKVISLAFKFGKKRTALTHLIRNCVWGKRRWNSPQLEQWVSSFSPECIFLSFSDDFFVFTIAKFFSKQYKIPIVCQIDDDYYFDNHFSINPLYWYYRKKYKQIVNSVLFSNNTSAVYISDKIKNKYNSFFHLNGETIYLASSVERRQFKCINRGNPIITYFGNIRLGRNKSLLDIANAIREINPSFKIEIYSSENERKYFAPLIKHPNILWGGRIPYAQVAKRLSESDMTIIVEGFSRRTVKQTFYSLSTKAADTLTSGVPILTYGASDCGVVEYMISTEASVVCTDKKQLGRCIELLLSDEELQRELYSKAKSVSLKNHNLNRSTGIFSELVENLVYKNERE